MSTIRDILRAAILESVGKSDVDFERMANGISDELPPAGTHPCYERFNQVARALGMCPCIDCMRDSQESRNAWRLFLSGYDAAFENAEYRAKYGTQKPLDAQILDKAEYAKEIVTQLDRKFAQIKERVSKELSLDVEAKDKERESSRAAGMMRNTLEVAAIKEFHRVHLTDAFDERDPVHVAWRESFILNVGERIVPIFTGLLEAMLQMTHLERERAEGYRQEQRKVALLAAALDAIDGKAKHEFATLRELITASKRATKVLDGSQEATQTGSSAEKSRADESSMQHSTEPEASAAGGQEAPKA